MSPAIPSDTRPLIDRLREAVPGLRWEKKNKCVVGRDRGEDVVVGEALYCWRDNYREDHAVSMNERPSDDEVVRIVRDWYGKTHPAKSILERTKELIREAVPGVEITEQPSHDGTYLHCTIGSELGTWSVYQPAGMTAETFERTKDKLAEAARKALVKPTNTPPPWVAKIRDLLNARTSSSWLGVLDGEWQVVSNKHGQRLEVTATDSTYRLTVKEDKGSASYSELRPEDLSDLAANICKMREDLGIPAEAQKFAQEMRDAGFEVDVWPASDKAAYATVRSRVTGREAKLHYGSMVGWACDEGIGLTREQVSTRVRLKLTKTEKTAQQEAAEKKGAESDKDRALLVKLKAATPAHSWLFLDGSYTAHDSRGVAMAAILPSAGSWDFMRVTPSKDTIATTVAGPEAALPLVKEWARSYASAEHEAFERRAREATTQYLQNAGMAVANVSPKMTADAMVDLLASKGVEATIETIDDHIAVCVTDPSTRKIHKAICDPAGNWLMDGEEVYGLVAATELKELAQRQAKGGTKMRTTRRQRIEQGVYLGAAKSAGDKARAALVALLAADLPASEQDSARAMLAKVFDTKVGAGFVSWGLGEAVDVLADQFEDGAPKAEAFAEALQVVGAMQGANAVIEAFIEPVQAALSGLMEAIPEPPKVRATIDAPAEEHEEPAHTGRRARAAR